MSVVAQAEIGERKRLPPDQTKGLKLDARNNERCEPVKERSFSIRMCELSPPEVGFVFRKHSAGNGSCDVSPKKELQKIVGKGDGAKRNCDVSHVGFPEQTGEAPTDTFFIPSQKESAILRVVSL